MDSTPESPTPESPTPEDSTTVQDRGPTAPPRRGRWSVVVAALAGLLVGGIVGGVAGWQIEQERVKDDVQSIRPIGTVLSYSDDTLRVRLRTGGGEQTYRITESTDVDIAEPGAPTEITEGATVFLRTRRGDDGVLEAAQVVVVP
jgi:hypothetical protein